MWLVHNVSILQPVRLQCHYACRTIPTATTKVQSNVQIQPVIFSGSNGAATFVASYPYYPFFYSNTPAYNCSMGNTKSQFLPQTMLPCSMVKRLNLRWSRYLLY